MFDPLPDVIRLRRKQRNLTQDQLARMAGVSRRQLSLLEDGSNVSLVFLLKVARALELTELPIGDLRLRAAPPELGALIVAADAVAMARQISSQFSDLTAQLDDAAESLDVLVEGALSVLGPPDTVASTLTDAVQRLAKRSAGTDAVTQRKPRSSAKASAKAVARRRGRE